MELHNLKPAEGSTKKTKRIGRGTGSGHGGTSTRGHKGAGSRSGTSAKVDFEGGQMPIARRLPKFGFTSPNRVEYSVINVGQLQAFTEEHGINTLGIDEMKMHRLARSRKPVKILCKGELTAAMHITAHAFTETAKKAIEAAGGTVNVIPAFIPSERVEMQKQNTRAARRAAGTSKVAAALETTAPEAAAQEASATDQAE